MSQTHPPFTRSRDLDLVTANRAALEQLHAFAGQRTVLLHRQRDGQLLALAHGDRLMLHGGSTLEALVHDLCREPVTSTLRRAPAGLPHARPGVPLVRLCWQYGWAVTGRIGLAPWLDDRHAMALLSWPDFRELGEDLVSFTLCQALAAAPLTPAQLQKRVGLPTAVVAGFLNAASLGGLLGSHRWVRRPQGRLAKQAVTAVP